MDKYQFSRFTRQAIREIYRWRYPPPYDVYNWTHEPEEQIDPEDFDYYLASDSTFFEIRDRKGDLLGFCSFGPDGQVPGGDYHAEALDIGIGLRPDLTGIGLGSDLLPLLIKLGEERFQSNRFRVTIAAFNKRSQKLAQKYGFVEVSRFKHPTSGNRFLVLLREK